MAGKVWLLTASPREAATGNVVTVRLAGGGTRGFNSFGSADWKAGLARPPVVSQRLGFDDGEFGAGAVVQALELSWGGRDADAKALADLYWRDQSFTLHTGPDGGSDGEMAQALAGRIADVATSAGKLTLKMADPAVDLAKPVLAATAVFAGSGGIEGDAEIKGQAKWRAWGQRYNVGCRSLLKANNIHVITDPAFGLQAIDQVYDRGNAAGSLTTVAWAGSIAATLAALIAQAVPDGGAAIAPSIACFKWWWANPGKLTCDIRGEIGSGYIDRPADIAARLIGLATGGPSVDATMLTAARAAVDYEAGWIVKDPGATIASEIQELLSGVGLWWGLSAAGVVEIGQWAWTAPASSLAAARVDRVTTFRPVSAVSLGWKPNDTVMARGDIAAVVLYSELAGTKPPADATRNRWYVSATDPGGTDGDGWKDISTTPAKLRLKVAGTWLDVSSLVTDTAQITDGANLGLTALWAGVVGAAKPESYATSADNIVKNGSFATNADGWSLSGGAFWAAASAAADPSTGFLVFPTSAANQVAYANGGDVIPLNDAKKLYVNLYEFRNTGVTASMLLQFNWLKADLSPSSINPYPQYTLSVYSGGPTGIQNPTAFVVEPPSDARAYQIAFVRGPASGIVSVTNVRIAKTQPAADVTLISQVVTEITGGALKTIAADYTGTVTGAYPIFAPTVLRSGASIKADGATSYSATKLSNGSAGADGGTISLSTSGTSKGEVTPSAFDTGSSEIKWRLTITVNGTVVGKHDCLLKKDVALPPSGGGGGGSSKTAYLAANQSQSGTTYAPINSGANPQLTVASGEKLYVTGSPSYNVSGTGAASRTATFKNQYSTDNSTWTDFASSITGSVATSAYNSGFPEPEYYDAVPGSANISQNVSVAAGSYYVRTVFICNTTGRTIVLGGQSIVYEAKV